MANTAPYQRQSLTYLFNAATTTTAGNSVQIGGAGVTGQQYYVVNTSATAFAYLKIGNSAADAATVTAPVAGTPSDCEVLQPLSSQCFTGKITQGWINAVSAAGTVTITVSCGEGA